MWKQSSGRDPALFANGARPLRTPGRGVRRGQGWSGSQRPRRILSVPAGATVPWGWARQWARTDTAAGRRPVLVKERADPGQVLRALDPRVGRRDKWTPGPWADSRRAVCALPQSCSRFIRWKNRRPRTEARRLSVSFTGCGFRRLENAAPRTLGPQRCWPEEALLSLKTRPFFFLYRLLSAAN